MKVKFLYLLKDLAGDRHLISSRRPLHVSPALKRNGSRFSQNWAVFFSRACDRPSALSIFELFLQITVECAPNRQPSHAYNSWLLVQDRLPKEQIP